MTGFAPNPPLDAWGAFTDKVGSWWNGTPGTMDISYPANSVPMGASIPGMGVQVPSALPQTQMPAYMDASANRSWMTGYTGDGSNMAAPTITSTPGTGGAKGWLSNGQNLSAVMQGIGALSSAWLGYQNLRNARDQLSFQKDAFRKNFANQTKSYNTSLEDRIRGRTADYAGKESDVQSYLDKHKLSG